MKKEIELAIAKQQDKIKALKATKADKALLQPLISELTGLKEKLKSLNLSFDRTQLESVLAKRFFVTPSFAIYGGVAGLFDYGPPGCALQNNLLDIWRQHFCLEEDMLEIETTNLTPESVFKVSGHVDRFADYMVTDSVTGDIFRADHLIKLVLNRRLDTDKNVRLGLQKPPLNHSPLSNELIDEYNYVLETLDNYQGKDLDALIKKLDIRAPESNNTLTEPALFNLMFDTKIGPTGQFKGYLRPETAQAHFINFKRLLESNNDQMPFASASIGKSFRNEISPRQGLLRVREFTMAEIEHFVHPDRKDHARFHLVENIQIPFYSRDAQLKALGPQTMTIGEAVRSKIVDNQTLGYFIARIFLFLVRIGIDANRLRFRQHFANEMAHYATDCWDCEIQSSYGWIESVGCADRSAYDLCAHTNATGEKLVARETLSEPIIKDRLVLKINRSKFGPAFKKNAALVQAYFDSFATADGEHDQATLQRLQSEMEANKLIVVKASDGNDYKVTGEMVNIQMEKLKITVVEYTPNVIEPSFGIGRILYSLLEHSFYVRENDEKRTVFGFPAAIAPTKALIAPISNKPEFEPITSQIASLLRANKISTKVDASSTTIGRRYARNDEVGTPFAITIDFQTINDGTVTLRERDSTRQIRESIPTIVQIVSDLVTNVQTWQQVEQKYTWFSTE